MSNATVVRLTPKHVNTLTQLEGILAIYKRMEGSLKPADVVEQIKRAKEINELSQALISDAEARRTQMLKDLGAL